MREPVNAAGKDILVKSATSPLKPLKQACASGLQEFELHWPTSLLLDDDRSLTDASSTYDLINLDLHEVATSKLAVDRQVEERAIAEAMLLLQEEPHRPHLLWQEWSLSAKLTANIPRGAVFLTGIVDCMSHASSPQANRAEEKTSDAAELVNRRPYRPT